MDPANAAPQVRGHVHKMLGSWLAEFTDLRQQLVQPPWPSPAGLRALTLEARPVPTLVFCLHSLLHTESLTPDTYNGR